ncbi:protein asteroid [Anopheles marshallii]|uniref:protein asteroid n=1 Tax=Anopheles marshallii TaxID=1521116 RepID=UPI00237B3193|nr:protein asteroid [Anopheles marshallii]
MGVRGLTTFIGANAAVYLKPFELHDSKLVIDGDNLCLQLFKRSQNSAVALGGNYDVYYRIVVDFFEKLKLVNVTPYVLLDGGYESRKMSVVRYRMVQRIQKMKGFHLAAISLTTPPMLREVFVDALKASGVSFMRCAFEADDEVAILARKLNCPVLSYDSDFYIHDVQYIPFVTLSNKVFHKVSDKEGENFKIGVIDRKQHKNAKHRSDGIKYVAHYGDEDAIEGDGVQTYTYLDCCLYTIDNLTGPHERLGKEMIPLFAVLLGNDYIERNVLKPFYQAIQSGRVNRKINRYERRIKVLLKWLQNHTLQSATRAIICHIKGEHKLTVYRQILTAMRGYNCEDCTALHYFGLQDNQVVGAPLEDQDLEQELQTQLEEVDEGAKPEGEFDVECLLDNEDGNENVQDEPMSETDDAEDNQSSLNNSCAEESVKGEEGNTPPSTEGSNSDEEIIDGQDPLIEQVLIRNNYTDRNWPEWFKELYRDAKVPRVLADLLHSNFYLNYPQIEDIRKPDSNALSLPILRTIFAILKTGFKVKTTEFKYITRIRNGTGIKNFYIKDVSLPAGTAYDPVKLPNVILLQKLFEESGIEQWQDLFRTIKSVPSNLRLYFLAMIYWAKNCWSVNLAHVHALIICILQLQIIDKALKSMNRNVDQFRKQNQSYLDQQRKTNLTNGSKGKEQKNTKPSGAEFNRTFYNKLTGGTSRAELMLAYDELIHHFSINEKPPGERKVTIDPGTMHTLANFQSVCFNLYALIPLLGYPYDNLHMHELYNSVFVYNVYDWIKARADLFEYERSAMFRHSPALLSAIRIMVEYVQKYVPELKDRKRVAKAKVKAKKPNQATRLAKRNAQEQVRPANDWEKQDNTSESEDESFVDTNNKFSQLLLAA